MVYEHTIPFGAPSQLRLMIAPDPEGNADLAVLDAFNQPMGNLRDMRVAMADLKAVVDAGASATAKNDKAVCVLHIDAADPRQEDIEVHYEDHEKNRTHTATITIEDFAALLKQLMGEG